MRSQLALPVLALLLGLGLAAARAGGLAPSRGGPPEAPDSLDTSQGGRPRAPALETRQPGESGRPRRGRRSTNIYSLLNRAGQWSYFIFQHFLPRLDCASLQARAAEPSVASGIAQACRGLGVQQHCNDINQKRQLPYSSPDLNCDVRTLAQAVYDNCCVTSSGYQPPRMAPTQPSSHTPSASQTVSCGRYDARPLPRIVNGVAARPCEFPWMAGILLDDSLVNCGASVVSPTFVLTAAHCVNGAAGRYKVQAGKHFLDSRQDAFLQTRSVVTIHQHPDYTEEGREFDDIALLELSAPLTYNDCVQPVCLPSAGDTPGDFQSCTVAGWGVNSTLPHLASQPRELQRVELTAYTAATCRAAFSTDARDVPDSMLCAANGMQGGLDACTGDSGGPLMCLEDGGRWVQHGIVSMGFGCALPGEPGYYTLVSHFRAWVDCKLQRGFHC